MTSYQGFPYLNLKLFTDHCFYSFSKFLNLVMLIERYLFNYIPLLQKEGGDSLLGIKLSNA